MPDLTTAQMQAAALTMQNERIQQRLGEARKTAGGDGPADDAELQAASRQFESLLLNSMIREMRSTIPESGLFPNSMAEDIFTSMLDEQYGDLMANGGGIGLARLIVEQMGQKNAPGIESVDDSKLPGKLK